MNKFKFIFSFFILIMLVIACSKEKQSDDKNEIETRTESTDSKSKSNEKIIIKSGELKKHIKEIEGKDVFIYKVDGTLPERPNDLEELSKDWKFYRDKTVESFRSGDKSKGEKYRDKFQQVNSDLSEYDESDEDEMFRYLKIQ